MAAARKYAKKFSDPEYVDAIRLFIKEEQKHGNNLGMYLDSIGEKRIRRNWGDSLFRWTRHLFTSMELWTLTVITVETTAQVYYQAVKNASNCPLLQQVCTDILIDEAAHIRFQMERMTHIFSFRNPITQIWLIKGYRLFYFLVITIVWTTHRTAFTAGGYPWHRYLKVMKHRFAKTLNTLVTHGNPGSSACSL